MVQNSEHQVLVGFQAICAPAHGRQAFELFKKPSSCLDRSSTLDKAKHFAESRINWYPYPAVGLFSDKAAECIDLNEGAGFTHDGVTVNCPAA